MATLTPPQPVDQLRELRRLRRVQSKEKERERQARLASDQFQEIERLAELEDLLEFDEKYRLITIQVGHVADDEIRHQLYCKAIQVRRGFEANWSAHAIGVLEARKGSNVACTFLYKLPVEVRLQIYSLVYEARCDWIWSAHQSVTAMRHPDCWRKINGTDGYYEHLILRGPLVQTRRYQLLRLLDFPLLRTCRQIYLESRTELYSIHTVQLTPSEALDLLDDADLLNCLTNVNIFERRGPASVYAVEMAERERMFDRLVAKGLLNGGPTVTRSGRNAAVLRGLAVGLLSGSRLRTLTLGVDICHTFITQTLCCDMGKWRYTGVGKMSPRVTTPGDPLMKVQLVDSFSTEWDAYDLLPSAERLLAVQCYIRKVSLLPVARRGRDISTKDLVRYARMSLKSFLAGGSPRPPMFSQVDRWVVDPDTLPLERRELYWEKWSEALIEWMAKLRRREQVF